MYIFTYDETGDRREIIVASAIDLLSIFHPVVAALPKAGFLAWQSKQLEAFKSLVEERFKRFDHDKLDISALESDEYKALLLQALETASRTASDIKLQALANALVNSLVPPTSKLPGKEALLRVISQMSDEEILALTVLYECETSGRDEFQLAEDGKPIITLEALFKKVKPKMGQEWSKEDNLVAYDGLAQLGLAMPPPNIMWNEEMVRITALGNRLIQWCQEPNIEKPSKAEG